MSDATVLTRYCFLLLLLLLFLLHVFLSYVLSLICEAVLCLELVFAELGQARYKSNVLLLLWLYGVHRSCADTAAVSCGKWDSTDIHSIKIEITKGQVWPSAKALGW